MHLENIAFSSSPARARVNASPPPADGPPIEELLTEVVSNEWVNEEYKHLVVVGSPKSLATQPGQFFNILCPSPDDGDLWLRRPQSVYRVDRQGNRLEFLYKCVGRGTRGTATLSAGDECNLVGPLGVGFKLDPAWKNIVVLGRGVGLATLAPISQFAGEAGIRVTALLSARNPSLAMSADLFSMVGEVIPLLDSDNTSALENVENILNRLIEENKADAFFTCGSNRLLLLMKRLAKAHNIPGQAAMEQIMACGLGPCYVCVRTFDVGGKKEMRRVCVDGPVFDLQECLAW
jgi:dihydroorotate dehydrogenase electron transfer subunit